MSELRQRRPVVKRRRRQTRLEREAERGAQELFNRTVLRLDGGECAAQRIWPEHSCYGPKQAHHTIKQQTLRAHISTLDLDEAAILGWLWDPAIGVLLCAKAHTHHSSRFRTVPLEALPPRCVDWAQDRDVLHLLKREHPPLTEYPDERIEAWRLAQKCAALGVPREGEK